MGVALLKLRIPDLDVLHVQLVPGHAEKLAVADAIDPEGDDCPTISFFIRVRPRPSSARR